MNYIDCNVWVGTRCTPTPHEVDSTAETIKIMSDLGISQAVVTHFSALEYEAKVGNTLVAEEVAAFSEHLIPAWVVLPGIAGDFPKGKQLKRALIDNDVKMARIFPSPTQHNFCTEEIFCEGLFDALAESGTPLLLDAGQIPWGEIARILKDHPNLNLILSNLTYRYDRYTYPLLERFDNFYLETSGLRGYMQIEDVCTQFGANRLIFGTNLPIFDAGSSFAIVDMADISDEQKQMIAGENILSLMRK